MFTFEEPTFRLLGPMRVRTGEAEADCGPAKLQDVLAVLLLSAGSAVRLDELASRVWGDASLEHARLHVYASRIRNQLNVDVARTPDGYRVPVPPLQVDVHLLRHLVRQAAQHEQAARPLLDTAVALWRGQPFTGTESAWLGLVGKGLHDEWFEACLARNRAWLNAGLHAELLPELHRLLAEYPANERLVEHQMLALYRSGAVGEALACFRDLTKHLDEHEGRLPAPTLQTLHVRMLKQDPSLLLGAAPYVPPAPANTLDPPGAPLVGRQTELRRLDELGGAKTPGGATHVRVVGILGPPGVGKTALAVQWAHQVKARFPGGCLQADLGAYGPGGPRGVGEVLDEFLIALGVQPARLPTDPATKRALYRNLLQRRPVLVLLDNVGAGHHATDLLPTTPGSLVVITSRDRLGVLARLRASTLVLGLLRHEAAQELLGSFLTREQRQDPAVEAIALACGGFPLAVCLAGARIATRPHESLADLAGQLADGAGRVEALDADADAATAIGEVFRWSYDALDPAAARLFCLLSLHPRTGIGVHAAAALAGLAEAEAHRLLQELARAHLVRALVDDRFAVHDLIAHYARRLLERTVPAADRAAALTALLDFYLAAACTAMDALAPDERGRRARAVAALPVPGPDLPTLDDVAAASRWLHTERTALVAATLYAGGHGHPAHLVHLASVLFRYLDHGGWLDDATRLTTDAAAAAAVLGDALGEADALANLGALRLRQADHGAARELLDDALARFTALAEPGGMARALGSLGRISWRSGSARDGLAQQQRAYELFTAAGDRLGAARTLTNIGAVHESLDELDQAMRHYEQAAQLCEDLRTPDAPARAWGGMAGVHQRRGDLAEAEYLHSRALDVFRRIGDRLGEATALANLGAVHRLRGQYHAAVETHEKALTAFREIGNRTNETEALNNLGEALLDGGHLDHARSRHTDALSHAEASGEVREQARAHAGLALAYHAIGGEGMVVDVHLAAALSLHGRLGMPVPPRLAALRAADPDGTQDSGEVGD
ncbi:SARP family transcriptional regulator [Catellatospora sp. TT07R-123]|uniref:AfsR/SARP family transcriptional regulator n=1 Tax=Catellatospora sp. TT07R-123 TaxID=2733863 RepID=UPI001B08D82D|nr:AfsR/SARP family transcriptional regulator [Catellatospora sp. TT07R-123]GHJ47567.1 SARP family transcriptional regulator [Catellatospora sp. TT07R-123]